MSGHRIWVLGAGQLGSMLLTAGRPLDLDVIPVDIDGGCEPDLRSDDIVTAEREQWPENAVTRALAAHPRFVNREVFPRLADRFTQKTLIDSLELATAPWRAVEVDTREDGLHEAMGDAVLLKRRMGGYDGRGQYWLRQAENSAIPDDWRGQAIAEARIPFDEEVSLVGVRNRQGQMAFYPLALNLHVNGILMASIAPLARLEVLQDQAEAMLGKLLEELDYVGVMAMECFRVGDQLLINELAPRVHNSGHWSLSGCSISQFEYHLRAIAELPLARPVIKGQTAMINLIGVERDDRWLAVDAAELVWYGKEVYAGRKVGHLNLTTVPDSGLMISGLQQMRALLPARYGEVIDWIHAELAS